MSIVTIANEAEALKKIWDALTGCSIAWEIENTNLQISCEMIQCWQGCGTRHGTWDDVTNEHCEECGTQHDGIFGDGNNGGVIYNIGTGMYYGIAWSDPSVGKSYYTFAYGSLSYVTPIIQKWGKTFFTSDYPISGGASTRQQFGNVTIKAQPGFDPFKVSFSTSTSELDNLNSEPFFAGAQELDVKSLDPDNILSKDLAFRQETLGKALLKRNQSL